MFSGTGFRLGRLAFERQPQVDGDATLLNTHIPSSREPLSDAACDVSFARALEVATKFPEDVAGFVCHSWLMDTQLAQYLPVSSNIIRFQRRFSGFGDRVEADWAPLEHVFHRRYDGSVVPLALLDEVPQRTTLEHAIVKHLRQGRHWYNQAGAIRRVVPEG
ncbi:hypothetical protein ACIA58_35700 [Kribbella sp. NPDC051586]|uniref:hypothetical protein n=1 Tax=Kribbella sp. NPDC051586 TaxID=3364118 RepID=UPI0037B3D89F